MVALSEHKEAGAKRTGKSNVEKISLKRLFCATPPAIKMDFVSGYWCKAFSTRLYSCPRAAS